MIRVGFAGTPPFAAAALVAILDAGFPVPIVLTRPDRPRGRGLKVLPSAVKDIANQRGLAVMEPPTLTAESRAAVLAIPLDVLVVAAYGLLLPPEIAQKWDSGVLFMGERGMLLADYTRHAVMRDAGFKDYVAPESINSDFTKHHREWIQAIKTGKHATEQEEAEAANRIRFWETTLLLVSVGSVLLMALSGTFVVRTINASGPR